MEIDRAYGRTENQLRPLACSRSVLHRAHGSASWSQGDTKVLVAVYGPKAGTKKNENPEKACFEVIWKPKTGQIGKQEKEYEMILKRTLQSICLLNVNPNTTTSVIVQMRSERYLLGSTGDWYRVMYDAFLVIQTCLKPVVVMRKLTIGDEVPVNNVFLDIHLPEFQVVNDDGALLPCAINATCAALVDAGIPLKHLAVAICCSLAESGLVVLDPNKLEEQQMKAFVYLVFPNSVASVLPKESTRIEGEPLEHGIITSVTHGVMPVNDYFRCLDKARAASAKLSDFLRRNLQSPADLSKAA